MLALGGIVSQINPACSRGSQPMGRLSQHDSIKYAPPQQDLTIQGAGRWAADETIGVLSVCPDTAAEWKMVG